MSSGTRQDNYVLFIKFIAKIRHTYILSGMPHSRVRHLFPLLSKRLKLWPVLGVLGPRQVGKSTLLRDQVAPRVGAIYKTMDRKELRDRAMRQPGRFLEMEAEDRPLIIDEIQKAPDLFDAIKARVDEKRIPGKYLVSGSTEFSQKTGIRESLTGRIGLFRLYPLTLAETEEAPFSDPWIAGPSQGKEYHSPAALWRRVFQGGMPGICFLRSAEERQAAFDAWLETTCYRDLQQIKGRVLSGDLAMDILSMLPKLQEPTIAEISSSLRRDARKIKSHLDALASLFVVIPLSPHGLGVGKTHYYFCDSGLCRHLGADDMTALKTWLLNECLAQFEYGGVKARIFHYRSSRKSVVDLVVERPGHMTACILTDEEAPGTYLLRTAEAFLKKAPQAKVWMVAPVAEIYKEARNISVVPYAGMG